MGKPLRVLIVEDSEDDATLLLRELRRGGFDPAYERVDTAEAMSAALARQTWDIIISDYVMPRFSGMDALKLLQKSGIDLPFIIVSGKIGEDIAVEAMKAGAHDYITKGNLARLIPAIERELRDVQVRRERRRAEDVLKSRVYISEFAAAHSEDELLRFTLDEVERLTGSCIGFFHYVDDDQISLRLQMWSTNTLATICTAEGKGRHYPISDAGVWVDCFYERGPVIHNDYEALPHKKGLPPGHAKVVRELVVPVITGEKIRAILGVGNKKTNYDDADIRTVSTLANLAWDIIERKKAEEALKKSETSLKKAQELGKIGNWEFDLKTQKINWSDEVYVLYERDKKLGPPSVEEEAQYYPPEVAEKLRELARLATETGKEYRYDLTARLPSGRTAFFNTSINAVKDEKGNVIQLWGTVQDITERKRAEEIRLENERLAYANEAKSEFLTSVSHDLRTPLNSIIGFSELLKQKMPGELNEKQEHFVDNVLSSSKHLLALIDDILDISKIEAGKIELAIEEISVPSVTDDVLTLIKEKAAKHKVILNKEFDPRLDVIEADKTKFKQILFNLLDNAVKFSKEEGGTVTITTKKADDMVKISVSDTGIGIKKEDIGKLFTKFQQLEIGRKIGGTGLGLAISKQLVELHGGRIRVESRYGEGSTFTFSLPLKSKKEKR